MWMANLLAYRAMTLLPCAPTRKGLEPPAGSTVDCEPVFTLPM